MDNFIIQSPSSSNKVFSFKFCQIQICPFTASYFCEVYDTSYDTLFYYINYSSIPVLRVVVLVGIINTKIT